MVPDGLAVAARPAARARPAVAAWAGDARVRLTALAGIGLLGAFQLLWRLDRADWHYDEWLYAMGGWDAIHARAPLADHPLLGKYAIGLGQLVVGRDAVGVRLVPALVSLAALPAAFALGRRLAGWWAGALAALLWAVLPRAYVVEGQTTAALRGDRFALLDTMANALALVALAAAWRWLERPTRARAAVAGLAVGVMLGTKLSTAAVAVAVGVAGLVLVRPWLEGLAQSALAAAVAGVTFFASYIPLGRDAPDQLTGMVDTQRTHVELGHRTALAGSVWSKEPWWANPWSWVEGQGALVVAALLTAALAAWWARGRVVAAQLWLTVLAVALVLAASPVALAHYWSAWLGPVIVLAAGGIVALLRTGGGARALGAALLLVLLASGAWTTVRIATAGDGDYQRAAAVVRDEGVPPRRALVLGTAAEAYFPDVVSVFGTGAPGFRPDLVVIERQFAIQVSREDLAGLRARAGAEGLVPLVEGDVELWYRPR